MKTKKIFFVLILIVVGLCMSAFALVPRITLENENVMLDVMYLNAFADDDILTLDVSFSNNQIPFEVLREPMIETNDNKISPIKSRLVNGVYKYQFEYNDISSNKVDIVPPVLYTPATIDPISTYLNKETVVKTSDEEWFEITDIIVDKVEIEESEFLEVKLEINPKTQNMPRFPELNIDGMKYGGLTAMYLDENGTFDYGEMIFRIPATAANEVVTNVLTTASTLTEETNCSIIIGHSMERLEANKLAFSSNESRLQVLSK